MATEIVLPQWGMEMQDGTVVKWLKNEGDPIEQGEPMVEIETAKLTSEMESTTSGVLAHILVQVGETVPVRTVLAIVAAPGETVPRPERATPAAAQTPAASAATSAEAAARPTVQATPVARRLAKDHGIDLGTVQGTGPNGRITDADLRRIIEGQPEAATATDVPVTEVVPLTGMRGAIAQNMLKSAQGTASVTLTTEADVTELAQLQRDLVAEWRTHRIRPLELEFIVKAVASGLKSHPRLNAILVDNEVRVLEEVNVGVAMALPQGLVVPVIRMADEKGLLETAQAVREIANKSRRGGLSPEETMGGTFTITALGAFDIDAFTPIINPPQVAILGVGRTVEKPAVRDGEVTIRSMMYLSLTFDHRALDGAPAAEFLRGVRRSLEAPQWMRE
jgi:pyruvate dehydrogenase E2 component (dihydrolipoamide acetyltransferase)